MATFGEKLKAARLNKGLKQSEVAEKLDCAPTSLTNWENDKVQPSLDVLSKLCEVYEISPLSILDRRFEYSDIVAIAKKPVPERTYEEQIALNFSEPILETGMMFIRHTLVKVGAEYVRQEPKTIDSTRRIILPEYIIGLLKKHKALQTEQRFNLGTAWKDKNLVFTNLSGGFYLGTNMNNKLKRIIAGSDLPQDLHLHSMRHTHASLLINSDVAARVIADRLGHSTTKTTLDTYSHVFAESEARAMQAVDMALFRRIK